MEYSDSLEGMASTAVGVLIPYLASLADKATNALIDKTANTAAGRLWELVTKKFQGNDQASNALKSLADAPADQAVQAAVETSLLTDLKHDSEFATAVSTQLNQISNTYTDLAVVNNFRGKVGKVAQIGKVIGDVNL